MSETNFLGFSTTFLTSLPFTTKTPNLPGSSTLHPKTAYLCLKHAFMSFLEKISSPPITINLPLINFSTYFRACPVPNCVFCSAYLIFNFPYLWPISSIIISFLKPTIMITSPTNPCNASRLCFIISLFITLSNGLGLVNVNGHVRVLLPAAIITACIISGS